MSNNRPIKVIKEKEKEMKEDDEKRESLVSYCKINTIGKRIERPWRKCFHQISERNETSKN
jgi:hypothetical protein